MPNSAGRTLRGAADFKRVFREGKAVSTPQLVLHLAVRPEGGPGRYGLVVSRKVGGAVVRNRVRRQLRAALEMAGGVKDGMDLVVVARAGVRLGTRESADQISKIMEGNLQTMGRGPDRGAR